jgi:lipoate-protein ligase A
MRPSPPTPLPQGARGVIRLLPYADADGATNMAADETLVRSAADGIASLRFYGWTVATLSLGYFQPHAVRLSDPRLALLPWVRRPSGGATLVHHHELTYAIALPHGAPWQTGEPWMRRIHRIITAALAELGLRGNVEAVGDNPVRHGDVLCFQQYTAGDLLSGGKKVVGSAQRKYRQALMQHGSILLAQSEHTPKLPGLWETAGVALSLTQVREAILRVFAADTGWHIEAGVWTEQEKAGIERLVGERYGATEWNERR